MFWVAIGLAVLIFAGAIGYAGISIFGSPGGGGTQVTGDDGLPMREVPSTRVTVDDTDRSGTETETANADQGASDGPPKFTQRLTPDGREIDERASQCGPGSGGEGTSVAGQSPGEGTAQPDAGSDAGAAQDNNQQASLPVGQRAIFYQERTGAQAGTAEAGSTIWTVVQESPGGDAPLEPAIRAEANIPELGLTMEMTDPPQSGSDISRRAT